MVSITCQRGIGEMKSHCPCPGTDGRNDKPDQLAADTGNVMFIVVNKAPMYLRDRSSMAGRQFPPASSFHGCAVFLRPYNITHALGRHFQGFYNRPDPLDAFRYAQRFSELLQCSPAATCRVHQRLQS